MAHSDWLGLSGRTAVITGGSGGLGRAMAAGFHAVGCRVVALDRDAAGAEAAARAVDASGKTAIGLACDITDPASVAAAADIVARDWGGCDVLVNNAGVLSPGKLEDVKLADWEKMLAVNLNGGLLAGQAFGRQMIARGQGSLIHVSSIAATQPQPFSGAYSPGKAALAMLSRQFAYEWGPKGVRSNVVSPGLVKTPMSQAFYDHAPTRAAREGLVPMRRIGRPEDMADAAVFLASARASYINGQEIVVDGGLSQTLMGTVPRPGFTG